MPPKKEKGKAGKSSKSKTKLASSRTPSSKNSKSQLSPKRKNKGDSNKNSKSKLSGKSSKSKVNDKKSKSKQNLAAQTDSSIKQSVAQNTERSKLKSGAVQTDSPPKEVVKPSKPEVQRPPQIFVFQQQDPCCPCPTSQKAACQNSYSYRRNACSTLNNNNNCSTVPSRPCGQSISMLKKLPCSTIRTSSFIQSSIKCPTASSVVPCQTIVPCQNVISCQNGNRLNGAANTFIMACEELPCKDSNNDEPITRKDACSQPDRRDMGTCCSVKMASCDNSARRHSWWPRSGGIGGGGGRNCCRSRRDCDSGCGGGGSSNNGCLGNNGGCSGGKDCYARDMGKEGWYDSWDREEGRDRSGWYKDWANFKDGWKDWGPPTRDRPWERWDDPRDMYRRDPYRGRDYDFRGGGGRDDGWDRRNFNDDRDNVGGSKSRNKIQKSGMLDKNLMDRRNDDYSSNENNTRRVNYKDDLEPAKDLICDKWKLMCNQRREICADPQRMCEAGVSQAQCLEWREACLDLRDLCDVPGGNNNDNRGGNGSGGGIMKDADSREKSPSPTRTSKKKEGLSKGSSRTNLPRNKSAKSTESLRSISNKSLKKGNSTPGSKVLKKKTKG